jgi:transcription elongation factor Elf1
MEEQFFTCPYCFEQISMLVDTSVREQTYIEDCEVCCNPIEIKLTVEDQCVILFSAESIEQ